MRSGQGTRAVLVAMIIAMVCLACAPEIHAVPSNSQVDVKRDEAAQAQGRLDELQAQLELRTEEYAALTEELRVIRGKVAAARIEAERSDRSLKGAATTLDRRVAGIYRSGDVDLLEVLVGTSSFNDFVTRMDWLRRVGRNDASLVVAVKAARERAHVAQGALERREQEQVLLRNRAQIKRLEMGDAVSQQRAFLGSLNAEIARLVREEEERQARLAAERARQAALAARALRGASASPREFDKSALGAGHPEALEHGMRYVGTPYVWGGTSPSGFDCSGLMQYVYAEIGITLPRTSRQQFRVGAYVPPDKLDTLVAGDLVFFGYGGDPGRIHHVGMYAGDGTFLHAPGTGLKVRVDSLLDRIQKRGDYVGAVRF